MIGRKQLKRPLSQADDAGDRELDEVEESSSDSESEEEPAGPPLKCAKSAENVSSRKVENMDKLLSKPLDWVQWCSSLSLK